MSVKIYKLELNFKVLPDNLLNKEKKICLSPDSNQVLNFG